MFYPMLSASFAIESYDDRKDFLFYHKNMNVYTVWQSEHASTTTHVKINNSFSYVRSTCDEWQE